MSAAVLLLALVPASARAEEPDIGATMSCERAPEAGRVKCSIEARAKGSRSISWSDVAIVELPEFAAALKGRLGPDSVVSRTPGNVMWAFGLVARAAGHGEARARVRLVVCEGAARCLPITLEVRAPIDVG